MSVKSTPEQKRWLKKGKIYRTEKEKILDNNRKFKLAKRRKRMRKKMILGK